MGTQNRSAIATLVERSTRYLLLVHLPGNQPCRGPARRPHHGVQSAAACVANLADLGPGKRDGQARRIHRSHRDAGLLLRSPLALATRHE